MKTLQQQLDDANLKMEQIADLAWQFNHEDVEHMITDHTDSVNDRYKKPLRL